MASKYPRIDLSGLKTMSIADRKSKVSKDEFATEHEPGSSVASS